MINLFNNKVKKNKMDESKQIKGSFFGFFVGDALGVPVEFVDRDELKKNKVTKMLEYGTHNQPIGTWSDDSSMVIATMNSLINNHDINYHDINYHDIMNHFLKWYDEGKYTPNGTVFDIGNATSFALLKYKYDNTDFICGSNDIYSNGNGSLMRILPIAIYLYLNNLDYKKNEYFEIIKKISSMTHSHIYSVLGCYIYSIFVFELLSGKDKFKSYKNLQLYLSTLSIDGLEIYNRIIKNEIDQLSEKEIKSSGYVVDTLEAAIWCLLTTNDYKEAVLKAVNLGNDTDTIAAITGGLAGLVYGYDSIPSEWIDCLQKKDDLEELISSFINKYSNENKVTPKIDLQIINETLDDLKNNPESCTLSSERSKNGILTIPESIPSTKISKFIKYLYDNDLTDKNYLENNTLCQNKAFEDLTLEEALTRLTFIIRGDRFCSGLLKSKVEDGTFLKLVEVLKKNEKN